jgi:hypothetical protein
MPKNVVRGSDSKRTIEWFLVESGDNVELWCIGQDGMECVVATIWSNGTISFAEKVSPESGLELSDRGRIVENI